MQKMYKKVNEYPLQCQLMNSESLRIGGVWSESQQRPLTALCSLYFLTVHVRLPAWLEEIEARR